MRVYPTHKQKMLKPNTSSIISSLKKAIVFASTPLFFVACAEEAKRSEKNEETTEEKTNEKKLEKS